MCSILRQCVYDGLQSMCAFGQSNVWYCFSIVDCILYGHLEAANAKGWKMLGNRINHTHLLMTRFNRRPFVLIMRTSMYVTWIKQWKMRMIGVAAVCVVIASLPLPFGRRHGLRSALNGIPVHVSFRTFGVYTGWV